MRNIAATVLIVVLAGCGSRPSHHPTDQVMINTFFQNEASFAELLRLFKQAGGTEVRLGQTPELEPLMRKLGVQMVHVRGQVGPQIEFTASATGWATGGSSKAYVWSETPKQPLVGNLDEYAKSHRDFFVYRQLTNNWYICHEHDG